MPAADARAEFPAATRADWLRLVGGSGDADQRLQSLSWRSADGLEFGPLYARPVGENSPALRSDAGGWDIRTWHAEPDAASAALALADDVSGGASSIALQLAIPGQAGLPPRYDAIAQALARMPIERIPLYFSAGDQYLGIAQCLMTLWDERGLSGANRRGGIHADPLGTLARTGALEASVWQTLEVLGQYVSANLAEWPNVRLLLADGTAYHDAGASEGEELAFTLATLVEYLRVLSFEDIAVRQALPTVSIGLAVNADLLMSVAKMRSARRLIARLAEVCGAPASAQAVCLWATTSLRMQTRSAMHKNSLRNSIAALAAAVGGADAITLRPHTMCAGMPSAAAQRLARNTQHLLKDESRLALVLDPAGGSGALEAMTTALTHRAWELFQQIERKGGMAKALLGGYVHERIAASAAARGPGSEPELADPDDDRPGPAWVIAAIDHAQTRLPALIPRPAAGGRS
jgi:methylmalonyl-CoA mutase